jgi:hypothetical protein
MIKKYILTLLKSTSIVVVISALGAYSAYLFNINYLATFLFLFVIQFIVFSFLGDIITNYFKEKTKQKELDFLEPLSSMLDCAYCNTTNVITFLPNQNERIEFECTKCKNKNLVNLVFSVARITGPVNVPSITGIPLTNEKETQQ